MCNVLYPCKNADRFFLPVSRMNSQNLLEARGRETKLIVTGNEKQDTETLCGFLKIAVVSIALYVQVE